MMSNSIKILLSLVLSFIIGGIITPFLTKFFYKYKLWKRSSRSDAGVSHTFQTVHNEKGELSTPRVGGIIVWASVAITTLLLYLLALLLPDTFFTKLNFLSRSQTLIPLGALVFASLLGLGDDLIQIFGSGKYARDDITNRRIKVGLIVFIALLISLWFVFKIDFTTLHIPFNGIITLGYWFIPAFIMVTLAVFSSSVIDGIDGLASGVLVPIFGAYTIIAYTGNQIDLAAFSAVITGSLLVFLWFNIPPARFYLGETGMIGLTVVLSVIAFLTGEVLVLPLIALPLVVTSLSVIIQVLSFKYRNGKRVFKVTPLHHHFEALGWPKYKVTMRYWVVSIVCATFGTIIALIS